MGNLREYRQRNAPATTKIDIFDKMCLRQFSSKRISSLPEVSSFGSVFLSLIGPSLLTPPDKGGMIQCYNFLPKMSQYSDMIMVFLHCSVAFDKSFRFIDPAYCVVRFGC